MFMLIRFLKSLALTLTLEAPLLVLLLYLPPFRMEKTERHPGRIAFTGILASFATLPYVWFVFIRLFENKIPYLITAESFAFIVESVIYMVILKTGIIRGLVCSLICNLVSFAAGWLLRQFL